METHKSLKSNSPKPSKYLLINNFNLVETSFHRGQNTISPTSVSDKSSVSHYKTTLFTDLIYDTSLTYRTTHFSIVVRLLSLVNYVLYLKMKSSIKTGHHSDLIHGPLMEDSFTSSKHLCISFLLEQTNPLSNGSIPYGNL